MIRVALDVDGVLADFVGAALDWFNKDPTFGPSPLEPLRARSFTHKDVTEFDIFKALKKPQAQVWFDRYARNSVCSRLAVLPAAPRLVDRLRALGCELVIVTSPYKAVPTWEYERRAWLSHHFAIPPRDVIFTSRKDLIRADVLIDDRPENLEYFPGVRLLVDRPWNQRDWKRDALPRVVRVKTISDILRELPMHVHPLYPDDQKAL